MKWLINVAVIVCAGLAMASCTAPNLSATGTVADVKTAQVAASNQAGTLKNLKITADGLSPGNVVAQKPKVQQLVADASGQNKQIVTALGSAAKHSAKDQKVIAASSNKTTVVLQRFGIGFLIAGIIALVAGFFLTTYIPVVAPWLRNGGVAAIVVGLLILSISYFLHAIMVVVGCLLAAVAAGGAVWVYLHRSEIVPDIHGVTAWVKSFFTAAPPAAHKDVA